MEIARTSIGSDLAAPTNGGGSLLLRRPPEDAFGHLSPETYRDLVATPLSKIEEWADSAAAMPTSMAPDALAGTNPAVNGTDVIG